MPTNEGTILAVVTSNIIKYLAKDLLIVNILMLLQPYVIIIFRYVPPISSSIFYFAVYF